MIFTRPYFFHAFLIYMKVAKYLRSSSKVHIIFFITHLGPQIIVILKLKKGKRAIGHKAMG